MIWITGWQTCPTAGNLPLQFLNRLKRTAMVVLSELQFKAELRCAWKKQGRNHGSGFALGFATAHPSMVKENVRPGNQA
jgi:hypothetical protein